VPRRQRVCGCVAIIANLDAVAVAVHAELAAAGNAASLDHRLEMGHVLHVLVHVGRQYLHNDTPNFAYHPQQLELMSSRQRGLYATGRDAIATSVSETIRKPPLVRAQAAIKNKKK